MTDYKLGIDVSHHQDPKKLDYKKLKAEGYTWMIARASYGNKPDETFVEHCKRAKEAGLLVGGYLFYRQTQSFISQHGAFIDALEKVDLDIMPAVDLEWNEQYDGKVNPAKFNGDARHIFASLAETYGRDVIAYLSTGFFQTLGNPDWLLAYPWWVAHYTQEEQPWCPMKAWHMWQYTGTGNTGAFAGNLDLNRAVHLPLIKPAPFLPPGPEPELDPGPATSPDLPELRSLLGPTPLRRIATLHQMLALEFTTLADKEDVT